VHGRHCRWCGTVRVWRDRGRELEGGAALCREEVVAFIGAKASRSTQLPPQGMFGC
jgi:hypothetical protein